MSESVDESEWAPVYIFDSKPIGFSETGEIGTTGTDASDSISTVMF